MRLVLLTTGIAVWVAGLAMLTYDLSVYRGSWASDLSTEAAILALSTAPALEFDDHTVAARNLSALQARPGVLAAALYSVSGALYASYARDGEPPLPATMHTAFRRVAGERVELAQPVRRAGETLGYIYLRGRYDVWGRVRAYLGIFVLVTMLSLAVAFLFASNLQIGITEPLDSMAQVAREMVERRDYSLRARKSSDDEIGVVVDAFNNMLEEIESRSRDLREADRRKDEFLATLAHELRNPLAPIRHAVKLLELDGIDETQRTWAREVISRQVQRMALLLDDLLDVSRITRGRLALKTERTNLETLIGAAVETARPLIDSKRHRLTIRLPSEPLVLDVDPLRISQSLSNLLTNAAKYTDPQGEIVLSVELLPEQIALSVTDNGIGFEPEGFPGMFTMFAQADSALERAEGGLGIGLALVKGLIELHGGTVSGTSAGVRQGSRFVIHLPRSLIAAEEIRAAPEPTPSHVARAPACVLVADDNRDAADSMAMILEMSGYAVQVAHTGQQALEIASKVRPQAMILDIGMPGITGYEVARQIRRQPWGNSTLLIAVTGWGQSEDKERARAAGFDEHMTKPVDITRIENLLREFAERVSGGSLGAVASQQPGANHMPVDTPVEMRGRDQLDGRERAPGS